MTLTRNEVAFALMAIIILLLGAFDTGEKHERDRWAKTNIPIVSIDKGEPPARLYVDHPTKRIIVSNDVPDSYRFCASRPGYDLYGLLTCVPIGVLRETTQQR